MGWGQRRSLDQREEHQRSSTISSPRSKTKPICRMYWNCVKRISKKACCGSGKMRRKLRIEMTGLDQIFKAVGDKASWLALLNEGRIQIGSKARTSHRANQTYHSCQRVVWLASVRRHELPSTRGTSDKKRNLNSTRDKIHKPISFEPTETYPFNSQMSMELVHLLMNRDLLHLVHSGQ